MNLDLAKVRLELETITIHLLRVMEMIEAVQPQPTAPQPNPPKTPLVEMAESIANQFKRKDPRLSRLSSSGFPLIVALRSQIKKWDNRAPGWAPSPSAMEYQCRQYGITLFDLFDIIRCNAELHDAFSRYPECGYPASEQLPNYQ